MTTACALSLSLYFFSISLIQHEYKTGHSSFFSNLQYVISSGWRGKKKPNKKIYIYEMFQNEVHKVYGEREKRSSRLRIFKLPSF